MTTDSTIIDSSTSVGNRYYYRITAVDVHGNESIPTPELGTTVTALPGVTEVGLPGKFGLMQNYPNPFNPSTTIKYELPKSSDVRVSVIDMLGREVSVLVDERREAGIHEVKFDASALSSGVYFYRLQAEDFTQTRRLLLMR
jgi:hypothetical protein